MPKTIQHLILLIAFISFCVSCKKTQPEDTSLRAQIISDASQLRYTIGYLDKNENTLIERAPYDTITILLKKTNKGLQPILKGTYDFVGAPIKNEEFTNATIYRNFIVTQMVPTKSCTLLLGDKMIGKNTLTIAPEIEEKTFQYAKQKETPLFAFSLNDSLIKAPLAVYKNMQNDIISYERFAFLQHKDLPIQALMYVTMTNSTDSGFYYKLLDITTP